MSLVDTPSQNIVQIFPDTSHFIRKTTDPFSMRFYCVKTNAHANAFYGLSTVSLRKVVIIVTMRITFSTHYFNSPVLFPIMQPFSLTRHTYTPITTVTIAVMHIIIQYA